MKLVDQSSDPAPKAALRLAARPPRLAGLRLGLVDNTKFNSDTLLRRLAERLARRHGATVALTSRKRSPSHAIDEAAVKALRSQTDFVVSGIGD
jgi:hypothetical protein